MKRKRVACHSVWGRVFVVGRSAQLRDAVTASLADCKKQLQLIKEEVLKVIEMDQVGSSVQSLFHGQVDKMGTAKEKADVVLKRWKEAKAAL